MGDGDTVFVACFGDRSWLNWALNWIHKWGWWDDADDDDDDDSHSGSAHKASTESGGNERERWIGTHQGQHLLGIQTRREDHRLVCWRSSVWQPPFSLHCCRVGCMFADPDTSSRLVAANLQKILPHPWSLVHRWSVCECLDQRLASEASSLGLSSRNSWSHCLFCQAAVQQFEPICNTQQGKDLWMFLVINLHLICGLMELGIQKPVA